MGSRMLPVECEHGVTVDDGDFGPCQDCEEHLGEDCPNWHSCDQCDLAFAAMYAISEAKDALVDAAVEWRRRVSIAAPPKFHAPVASTKLAEAVDHYRSLLKAPS